jgi:hypothetical protein
VRELLGHYMSLEELYLEDTTDMAIRIDVVVGCVVLWPCSVIACVLTSDYTQQHGFVNTLLICSSP